MIPIENIQEIFSQMENNGIYTNQSLLYGYFFTDKNVVNLEKAKTTLLKNGFDFADLYENEGIYWLHMERIEIHNPDSLFELNKELYQLADYYNLQTYDGFDVGNPEKGKPLKRDTYVVPEEFGMRQLISNNYPKLTVINKAFERFPHKEEFSFHIIIAATYEIVDENQLPTPDALDKLDSFEQRIESNLLKSIKVYYVGRETNAGERKFTFCTDNKEKAIQVLTELKSNSTVYPFDYKIIQDTSWKTYFENLKMITEDEATIPPYVSETSNTLSQNEVKENKINFWKKVKSFWS